MQAPALIASLLASTLWAEESVIQLSETDTGISAEGGSLAGGIFEWTPATQEIPWTYPEMVQLDRGFVINLDTIKPFSRLRLSVAHGSLLGPDCREQQELIVEDNSRVASQDIGRYVYWGVSDACETRGGTRIIADSAVPRWIRALAKAELPRRFSELTAKLGPLDDESTPTLILGADLSSNLAPRVRADAGWRNTVFARFYGSPWRSYNTGADHQIRMLFAHELIHLWIGKQASFKPGQPWLHEGAAEYLSYLLINQGARPNSRAMLRQVSRKLKACDYLKGGSFRSEYDCGFVLYWLIDLDLQERGRDDLFQVLRKALANGDVLDVAEFSTAAITASDILKTRSTGVRDALISKFIARNGITFAADGDYQMEVRRPWGDIGE